MTIKTEHAGAKNRGEMPHDQIGYWSEVKPDIIRDYAAAYAKILSAQKNPSLSHVYIDAFAGWGVHKSNTTGNFVPGSPINALSVEPPFREYHFIDLDRKKVASLKKVAYTPSPQMPLWGPPAEEHYLHQMSGSK